MGEVVGSETLAAGIADWLEIAESPLVIAVTGAGISCDSGIPSFIDAGGNKVSGRTMWSRRSFYKDYQRAMLEYRSRWREASSATPNLGHMALAMLTAHLARPLPGARQRRGRVAIITKCVDGLQTKANAEMARRLEGADFMGAEERTAAVCALSDDANLIELHGNLSRLRCSFDRRHSYGWPETSDQPPFYCTDTKCSREKDERLLRPDVVLEGDDVYGEGSTSVRHLTTDPDLRLILDVGCSTYSFDREFFGDSVRLARINPQRLSTDDAEFYGYDYYAYESSTVALTAIARTVWPEAARLLS